MSLLISSLIRRTYFVLIERLLSQRTQKITKYSTPFFRLPKVDEGEDGIERSDNIGHANYDSLWNYYIKSFDYEESDQLEHEEIVRAKRLITPLQINIGCVKGYRCCHNPRCRPFCSLCNRYGNSKYNVSERFKTCHATTLL